MRPPHAAAQLRKGIEGKGAADEAGQSTQDPPILARFTRRKDGAAGQLHASLSGDVAAVLLGIGSPRKDDVGARRTAIAVMSLIDDERPPEAAGINLVGAEKVENLDIEDNACAIAH